MRVSRLTNYLTKGRRLRRAFGLVCRRVISDLAFSAERRIINLSGRDLLKPAQRDSERARVHPEPQLPPSHSGLKEADKERSKLKWIQFGPEC